MSSQQFPVPGGAVPHGSVGPPAAPAMTPAAPPGAYHVPVGGYQNPLGGYQPPRATTPHSRRLGAIALIAALVAAIVAPLASGMVALQIGGRVLMSDLFTASGDLVLAALSPVRTPVLWVEVLFWSGTVSGTVAIVLGIMAAAKKRGRGMGITAIVLAALGPGGFLLMTSILFGLGNATGVSPAS